jgi:Zn-dependent metalloprotease
MKTRSLLGYLLLALAAPLLATAQQVPPNLQARPLHAAAPQAVSAAVAAPTNSSDPRAAQVGDRLKALLRQVHQANPAVLPEPQGKQQAAMKLRQRSGGDVTIRMRHNTGTPRLIEGANLEPATAMRTGSDETDDLSTSRNFLRENRELLRIRDPDSELVLEKRERDQLGRRHLRFEQRYNGVRVWPANIGVHLDGAGRVELMTGAYVPTPEIALSKPKLTREEAVARGRLNVPSGDRAQSNAPELIIYAPGEQTPRLAWKVDLLVSEIEHWLVVVDAGDGRILTHFNQVYEEAAQGSGVDLFGQTRPLNLWFENGSYFMCDTSKKMFDLANSDPPNPGTTRGGIVVVDARNQPADNNQATNPDLFHFMSSTPNGFNVPQAVSAAFTVSRVYDFYLSVFNRNSFDDKGTTIPVIARYGNNLQNAFFGAPTMYLGDADKFAGALDVVAHEVSHGVTQTSSNLVYQFQSGAMNESFSDILGEMCEFHSNGSNDWLLGTQLSKIGRNMKDPGSIQTTFGPYPSKMSEFYNLDINTDRGGVHINSSIINHCYYLVTEGLQGGIGRVDAEKIFYRANTVYLMQNSQFVDVRLACLRAARDLFGQGSTQEQRVAASFDAVEIFDTQGTPGPTDIPAVNAQDSTLFLYGDQAHGFLLARRETALNDPNEGHFVGQNFAALRSASVNGGGDIGVYVTADHDIALFRTDGQSEQKLGFPGVVNSVSMSPDGSLFGFVFLDANGQPDNQLSVIDVVTPNAQPRTFVLKKPLIDGGLSGSIAFADVMAFTADSRFIVYDALNMLQLANGTQVQVFSIYSIELANGVINEIIPAQPGYDIGNPSLGHTSDNFLTFEAVAQNTQQSTVLTADLNGGTIKAVGQSTTIAAPHYTGADDGVVFTVANPQAHTGVSLVRQPLAADRLTAAGNATLWIADGGFGCIYRRGAFQAPADKSPFTRLANISTRMRVLTGERVLIGGFLIDGNAPKKVLIRGIGPSLTGVGPTLPNPVLQLKKGSTVVAANDNWRSNQQAEIQATTIPPPNDLEAAIVTTLQPGEYTAILQDQGGQSGIGIVEVYDLAQSANSRLANISTRGFVDVGDNAMIGGLIVTPGTDAGTAPVIVRAIGPTLGAAGIQGPLMDPTLELHNGNGTTTASNNNWRETQEAEIIATTVAPKDNRESAIVATLVPGRYTAVVRGTGGSTGVALVEVFHLK